MIKNLLLAVLVLIFAGCTDEVDDRIYKIPVTTPRDTIKKVNSPMKATDTISLIPASIVSNAMDDYKITATIVVRKDTIQTFKIVTENVQAHGVPKTTVEKESAGKKPAPKN